MEFHAKTGTNIDLRFGNTFAERRNADQTYGKATLFSSKPLPDEQLFEVEIREKVTRWDGYGGLVIGLTTLNPDSVNELPTSGLFLPQSWTFYKGGLWLNDNKHVDISQANFDYLAAGSRVGILRRASAALHLYVNGVDQGSFFASVPVGCYAVVDVFGNCTAVALNNDTAKGMVSLKLEPWQIPEFKSLMETSEPGFSISSDHLQHKVLPGFEWFLKVYPNGYEEGNAHVAVELCVEKSDKKCSATAPFGKLSISIASAQHGNASPRVSTPRFQFVQNAVCVIEKFASQEAIEKLCGEGSLIISGEVFVEAPFSMHFAYLRQLFESGAFSDFLIKVENSPFELAVHKSIIGAASSVMMGMMLNSEFDESKRNEITIKQSSLDAVKAMLLFIYGDPLCFHNLEQLSIDVLKLSDQYDLDELKRMCAMSLGGMVTKENALQLAELGYLCNASELKTAVSLFIFVNREITSQDAWMDLGKRHSELIIEILMYINSKLYEALSVE